MSQASAALSLLPRRLDVDLPEGQNPRARRDRSVGLMRPILDVLRAWLTRNAPGHPAWQWVGLVWLWPTIVGETLARVSSPLRLQDRVLTVQVVHPVWLAEMRPHADMLLDNIRSHCPWCDVTAVQFEVRPARRGRSEPPSQPLRATRLPPDLASRIEAAARSIPDARIRRHFIRACWAYWRRQGGGL